MPLRALPSQCVRQPVPFLASNSTLITKQRIWLLLKKSKRKLFMPSQRLIRPKPYKSTVCANVQSIIRSKGKGTHQII